MDSDIIRSPARQSTRRRTKAFHWIPDCRRLGAAPIFTPEAFGVLPLGRRRRIWRWTKGAADMKRVSLYSSSDRTRKGDASRAGVPADASVAARGVAPADPHPRRAPAGGCSARATSASSSSPPPDCWPWPSSSAHAALTRPAHPITQDDIDAAVLHTLETAPLPSHAAKAYEARPPLRRPRARHRLRKGAGRPRRRGHRQRRRHRRHRHHPHQPARRRRRRPDPGGVRRRLRVRGDGHRRAAGARPRRAEGDQDPRRPARRDAALDRRSRAWATRSSRSAFRSASARRFRRASCRACAANTARAGRASR